MHTINHTLEEQVLSAEGKYLEPQGMSDIERYAQTYATRLETYHNLREQSNALILQTLKRLGQNHPDLINKHGQRCQFDMACVLRCVALSILRDDEVFFIEEMMSWLDTILVAYKRHDHCAEAYQMLMHDMEAALPSSNIDLIRPYIDSAILTLQSHANH